MFFGGGFVTLVFMFFFSRDLDGKGICFVISFTGVQRSSAQKKNYINC